MEPIKIINPKTHKKINVGGVIYNTLKKEGYIENEYGELIKPILKTKKIISSSSSGEDYYDEDYETDLSGDYVYSESEEEINEELYDDDEEEIYTKKTDKKTLPDYEEEEYEYYEDIYNTIENDTPESLYPTFVYSGVTTPLFERMTHVRCIECNKPISLLEKEYNRLRSSGATPDEAYSKLNIKRYCCKMHLEFPPVVNYNQPNKELIMGSPSAKVIRSKTIPNKIAINKNPYLKPSSKNIDTVNTNVRVYERGLPVQENKVYKNLKTRPLGSKYTVSYIGK